MTTLKLTITAENLPALDTIWTEIGCRITWNTASDRLEIDERPSQSLEIGQQVWLHVNVGALEELASWADEYQQTDAPALIALYHAADDAGQQTPPRGENTYGMRPEDAYDAEPTPEQERAAREYEAYLATLTPEQFLAEYAEESEPRVTTGAEALALWARTFGWSVA